MGKVEVSAHGAGNNAETSSVGIIGWHQPDLPRPLEFCGSVGISRANAAVERMVVIRLLYGVALHTELLRDLPKRPPFYVALTDDPPVSLRSAPIASEPVLKGLYPEPVLLQ
jgi:hypothetical protein